MVATKNIRRSVVFRDHLLDRILLGVGSVGMIVDGFTMGAFAGRTDELIVFRLVLVAYCLGGLAVSLLRPSDSRKQMYSLVCVALFAFVSLMAYLNYVNGFGFEYLLTLHVGVIISSIYFRSQRLLLIYLAYAYALVTISVLSVETLFVPARMLLSRMILTMACGYGLNMLNRDAIRRLKKSDQRFRLLAENSPDLIAMHDPSGTIEYVNPAVRRMLGFSHGEAIGLNTFELIHPEDRAAARRFYSEELFRREQPVLMEYRLQRKDGTSMWVEVVGTAIGKTDGIPNRIITTFRDIEERKLAEAEMMRYQENLVRINNELDQFAYIVSHDLKAPLRGISNLTTFIEEDMAEMVTGPDQQPGELASHLALLRGRVGQMEQFIEDVLAYSRAGRVETEWEPVDLNELLSNTVENLSLPPTFKVVLPAHIPPVHGARVQFEQIFSNLISNAWKHHHRESGTIQVEYRDSGKHHVFVVRDDGPGIPREYHERIFEVFQQLESRDRKGGTGVGLAIVRKIVRSAGGNIKVKSGKDEGTAFRILWPRKRKALLDPRKHSTPGTRI